MYDDIPGHYRMCFSAWRQLPEPAVVLFLGPDPVPVCQCQPWLLGEWQVFENSKQWHKEQFLGHCKDQKEQHIWSLGMADKCMWQREGLLIGSDHVGEYLYMFACACTSVCVCACVCVQFNPWESLSLKENRCRFTYVEGPQPVMRLAGWDLSLQQMEGAYLINAQS